MRSSYGQKCQILKTYNLEAKPSKSLCDRIATEPIVWQNIINQELNSVFMCQQKYKFFQLISNYLSDLNGMKGGFIDMEYS